MKIRLQSQKCDRQRGSATLVVIVLLAIMGTYTTIQFTAARRLQNNLRLIERRQLQRLKASQSHPSGQQASDNIHGQGSDH